MNNKILESRWKVVDNLLSTYLIGSKWATRDLKDELQDIFNRVNIKYTELGLKANNSFIGYFKRKAEVFLKDENVSGYVRYNINMLNKRFRLTNCEVIIGLLIMAYTKKQIDLNKCERALFESIMEISYKQGQKDCNAKKIYSMPKGLMLLIMTMPAYKGNNWEDYVEGNLVYNAKQIYAELVVHLQLEKPLNVEDDGFKHILEVQDRRYLAKKKDTKKDVYYGSLDNYVSFLANQSALEGMKKQGIEKVRFIAVKDEKTTDMCDSLDNQIFNIEGLNVYSRYSKEDGKNVIYRTEGLQVGANLPPIDNGYHHCRSTIYPER